MKNKLLLPALLTACLFSASSFADMQMQQGGPGGQSMQKNPQIEAALKECASSVSKDSQGRPDRTAFEACMTAKGFKKPEGRGLGAPHGQHNSNSSSSSTSSVSGVLR